MFLEDYFLSKFIGVSVREGKTIWIGDLKDYPHCCALWIEEDRIMIGANGHLSNGSYPSLISININNPNSITKTEDVIKFILRRSHEDEEYVESTV